MSDQNKVTGFSGGLTAMEARVLWSIVELHLAGVSGEDCGPTSVSKIADMVGADQRSVALAINRAVEMGMILIEPGKVWHETTISGLISPPASGGESVRMISIPQQLHS
jgi:hypothetical protein